MKSTQNNFKLSGVFHLRIPPPLNKTASFKGGILIMGGILIIRPHFDPKISSKKFSPLRGEKRPPKKFRRFAAILTQKYHYYTAFNTKLLN